LSASGHAETPEDERKLAARIGEVLKEAGPAVGHASFSGSAVSGDPREIASGPKGEAL
jgi:hypothetical protein